MLFGKVLFDFPEVQELGRLLSFEGHLLLQFLFLVFLLLFMFGFHFSHHLFALLLINPNVLIPVFVENGKIVIELALNISVFLLLASLNFLDSLGVNFLFDLLGIHTEVFSEDILAFLGKLFHLLVGLV